MFFCPFGGKNEEKQALLMFFGLIIIVIGLVFLLKNLGIISNEVWPIIWPSLIMIVGLKFVCKRKKESKLHKLGSEVKKFGKQMHKNFSEQEKEAK